MLGLSPARGARSASTASSTSPSCASSSTSSSRTTRRACSCGWPSAVMIQVDAEILLIDEVLAVGDAAFQQKCFDEFARIRRSGTTVLLVTHDMGAVAALLRPRDAARARARRRDRRARAGRRPLPAAELLARRTRGEARSRRRAEPRRPPTVRARPSRSPGDGGAEIVEAWFEDEHGRAREVARRRPAVQLPCACASTSAVEDPLVRRRRSATRRASTSWGADDLDCRARGRLRGRRGGRSCALSLRRTSSRPDRYWVTPAVARPRRRAERGSTAATRFARSWSRRPRRPAGSSTCPSRSTSSAARPTPERRAGEPRARRRRPPRASGAPIKGPTALGNDPRRLLAADVDAGRHRLPAALLRLGAGLPVAARCSR